MYLWLPDLFVLTPALVLWLVICTIYVTLVLCGFSLTSVLWHWFFDTSSGKLVFWLFLWHWVFDTGSETCLQCCYCSRHFPTVHAGSVTPKVSFKIKWFPKYAGLAVHCCLSCSCCATGRVYSLENVVHFQLFMYRLIVTTRKRGQTSRRFGWWSGPWFQCTDDDVRYGPEMFVNLSDSDI